FDPKLLHDRSDGARPCLTAPPPTAPCSVDSCAASSSPIAAASSSFFSRSPQEPPSPPPSSISKLMPTGDSPLNSAPSGQTFLFFRNLRILLSVTQCPKPLGLG